MNKEIVVDFELNGNLFSIPVRYETEMLGNVQTITCRINTGGYHPPVWLAIRCFELRSIIEDGIYTPLFIDNEHIKSVNAALFIDKAYHQIMAEEHLTIDMV